MCGTEGWLALPARLAVTRFMICVSGEEAECCKLSLDSAMFKSS